MFDFKDLSPIDFEDLVRDLLQKKLKIRMESFKPGKDLGIDFRYAIGTKKCIIQAKHYLKSGEAALVVAAKHENGKVKKLNPVRYIFVTSLPMSNTLKRKIKAAMPDVSLTDEDIIGQEDLNGYLLEYPEVEKANFKLWLASTSVLERILHSGIYHRTDTELSIIKEMVPKFVQNDSVNQAEKILKRDGTLIIAGDPGVGKTTLARILITLHFAQDWEIFVINDIEEAFKIAGEGANKLIFFDDFMGQVRLSPDHVRGLDQRLPPFLSRVRQNKNLRFILTTREYILNQALRLSQRMASAQLAERRYILDVGKYTREVKAKIFYNHLYFSSLNEDQIRSIIAEDFYLKVIDHKNFNPRLIEVLTGYEYQKLPGKSLRDTIENILANPNELWSRPYRDHISADDRALMLALLLSPPLAHFADLRSTFGRVSAALDQNFPIAQIQMRFATSLKELEGAMIAISDRTARFANPGLRDFLQSTVMSDEIIISIVGQLETYEEIYQAWTIFRTHKPTITPTNQDAKVWLGAIDRMLDSAPTKPIQRLELVLDIGDHLREVINIEVTIMLAISQLEVSNISESDGLNFVFLLENVQMHLISLEMQDKLHSAVTSAACKYLVDNAGALAFEEITGIYDALATHGSDQNASNAAAHIVISEFIDNIDAELSNFSAEGEVDDFEDLLTEFVKKTGYKGTIPEDEIADRKMTLEIRSQERQAEGMYKGGSKTYSAGSDDTTSSIRSMFSTFKSSD